MSDSKAPTKVFAAAQAIEEAIKDLDEGDTAFVLRMVCQYHNVQREIPTLPDPPDQDNEAEEADEANPSSENPSLADYMREFKSLSAPGFAAHLAFYWKFKAPDSRAHISSQDYGDACRAAGRPVPQQLSKQLHNAKAQGYLEDVGPGKYKLTTTGENYARGTLRGSKKSSKASNKKRASRSEKTPGNRAKKSGKKAP